MLIDNDVKAPETDGFDYTVIDDEPDFKPHADDKDENRYEVQDDEIEGK